MENRICECGHFESSHKPGGCQDKSDTSCHAFDINGFCLCDKFTDAQLNEEVEK